jgi:hypothetical protein
MPEKPFYQNIAYRLQNPLMPHMLKLKEEGKLNAAQLAWFRPIKPEEELFDTQIDPHELNNLAQDPKFASKLKELREAHKKWLLDFKDYGELKEMDMVKQWWNGKDNPPETAQPIIYRTKNKISISSQTTGASIGYRKSTKDAWIVYDKPIDVKSGDSLYVFAQRIGYTKSEKSELIK